MIPFLDRLDRANRILIVGCGGGFDVYSGVPLAIRLLARGKYVALANYSFTSFDPLTGERLSEVLWRVDTRHGSLPYFPERWLCEWLAGRDVSVPVYAFIQPGVLPLAEAFREIVTTHAIDLVVLVDGGTDSLIFGDEPGLGTVTEDAITLVAADEAAPGRVLLAALGFGIDEYHGVSHHSFLENVATLGREGGYLGAFSLTPGSAEADALLELIDLANARQTTLPSIVNNSVASALRGEFGNFHATDRTGSGTLFINPLMGLYWTFDAARVVAHMAYGKALRSTTTRHQARLAIEEVRYDLKLRPRQPIPL
ncbi:MAG: DUF1152 domain-containing protein [Bauldia sp.]|nr:DUF1152 domain-containing protein [Bauldia sp.]MCW5777728.1 DUF1152 domain-containing protein [Phycisphaeraceae bacterium]